MMWQERDNKQEEEEKKKLLRMERRSFKVWRRREKKFGACKQAQERDPSIVSGDLQEFVYNESR